MTQLLYDFGFDPAVLYAGAGGGLLRALSRRQLRLREMLLSPCCGALASAYLTLPLVRLAGLSPPPRDSGELVLASAFLIGTCAMWISDIVLQAVAHRLGLPGRTREPGQ